MSEYKLTKAIIELSVANQWASAKQEWSLDQVYEADEPMTCLCGHFPIIEICSIKNKINGVSADVGNCCVKKFMELPSDKIFQAVKRVRKDSTKSLNEVAIEHGYSKRWITEWEKDFYLDIMNKRKLTEKQIAKKKEINELFALKMKKSV
ncbi:hypothetical protein [Aeromonas jandaei]|uniref:hypothetical protein n=1 Tax=Aeromonas jandaei TaxID=650 RepID=UPI001ADD9140|nr:hypothetical protein [Aeromonas jandaei]QTL93338.1 hypothetical protein AjGTCBM29_01183 [Aeromonas jandaei]